MKGVRLFFCSSFLVFLVTAEVKAGKALFFPSQLMPDTLTAWHAFSKGQTYEQNGQADSAGFFYARAAVLYEQQGLTNRFLVARQRQGNLLFKQRKNTLALQFYQEFLAKYKNLLRDEAAIHQEACYKLGITYARKSLFVDALKWIHAAEELQLQLYKPGDKRMAPTYETIGRLYFVAGRFTEAISYHKKYLELNRQLYGAAHLSVARAYNYLGLSYTQLADHQTALDYYEKAVAVTLKSDSVTQEHLMHLNRNMGLVYGRMGKYEQALTYIKRALIIRLELAGDPNAYAAEYYSHLGSIYTDMGSYQLALNYLQKSLAQKLQAVGPTHSSTADTYSKLGKTYLKVKDYARAMDFYESALQIYSQRFRGEGEQVAGSLQAISQIYLEQDNVPLALKTIQKAINALVPAFKGEEEVYKNPLLSGDILHKLSLIRVLEQKAKILERRYEKSGKTKDVTAAYRSYLLAQQLTQLEHRGLLSAESRMFLIDEAHSLYEKTIRTGLKYQQVSGDTAVAGEILAVMEQNKSKLLLQALRYAQRKNGLNVPDSLQKKERALLTNMAYFEKQLYEEQAVEPTDSSKLEELSSRIFATKRELERLLAYFEKEVPQYYQLKFKSKSVSIEDVQKKLLDDNSQLLEYFVGDSALYIFQVSKQGTNILTVKVGSELLVKTTRLLRGLKEQNYALYTQYAFELYELLLKPALANAPNKKRLIIIPDGILGYLPFEVLLTSPARQGESYRTLPYLLKKYAVSYHYSVNLMAFHAGKRLEEERVVDSFVGFAPDFDNKVNPLLATRAAADEPLAATLSKLPEAQKEVKTIADLWNGTSLLGAEATEERFRQLSGTAGILHLATHAVVNDANPMYSMLVFSRPENSRDDGFLHTYELYTMKLKADLVCLSACNTGTGKMDKGEGIMSLARGFMYAGVPNVLMSLWSVPDGATSLLMQYFYEAMRKGNSKEESLRLAKLRYLSEADDNTANPYYWGAFVYLGNTRKENNANLIVLTGAVFLLACLSYAVYRHKVKPYRQK